LKVANRRLLWLMVGLCSEPMPFLIGVYEVTQGQYEKVTGTSPSKFNKANGGGPDHPVEMVSG